MITFEFIEGEPETGTEAKMRKISAIIAKQVITADTPDATPEGAERVSETRSRQREGAMWKPIQSAPKDGSGILLLSKPDEEVMFDETVNHPAKVAIGHWDADGSSWVDELGRLDGHAYTLSQTGVWLSGSGWFQPNEVTHWMPLPSANADWKASRTMRARWRTDKIHRQGKQILDLVAQRDQARTRITELEPENAAVAAQVAEMTRNNIQLRQKFTELELELKLAQETIANLRDADKRAVGIAAEEIGRVRDEYEARLREAEGKRDCDSPCSPKLHGTDGACHCWWAGHDHTAKIFKEKLTAAEARAELAERELSGWKSRALGAERERDNYATRVAELAGQKWQAEAALEKVEWIEDKAASLGDAVYCPWCDNVQKYGHRPDCARQVALHPATHAEQEVKE